MYKKIALTLHFGLVLASAQTAGPGRALQLDGTTADYIIVNPIDNFIGSAITIEFWMRTSDTTKAGTPISYAVTGQDNMLFIHDYRDFRFRLDGTAIPASGGTGVSANDGQWHHIAMMWRNTGLFILYKDGVQQYSTTGIKPGFLIPDPGVLVIGQEQDTYGGGFQASEAFLGSIDEVRIWNIQRTELQIRTNMHRSLVGDESGLQVYYRMDEPSGTSMTDSGGDNRTGTLFGATRVTSSAPVGLPVDVITSPPTAVTNVSATFNGSVDPKGLASAGFFEYGTDPNQLTIETPRVIFVSTLLGPIPMTRTVNLSPSTTYYFRAVGSNTLGEVVGITRSFSTWGAPSVVTRPATQVTADSATLSAIVNPRGTLTRLYIEYGTTTNYAFRTAITPGLTGFDENTFPFSVSGLTNDTVYHFRGVASNSFGFTYGSDLTFVTQTFGEAQSFTGYQFTDAAWGDIDNDQNLDLILSGTVTGNLASPVTLVEINYSGYLYPYISLGVAGRARWGDFDNDGWLDLFVMGYSSATERVAGIRRNNRNYSFSDIGAGLPGLADGDAAWGDYDRDGRLDLVVTGSTDGTANGRRTLLLRNLGNGTFTNLNVFSPLWRGSVAWGDVDNDGDLDLALCGLQGGTGAFGTIYRNNGTGWASGGNFQGTADGSLAFGDYDNDGDLDLLVSGSMVAGTPLTGICQIWRNTGGSFAQAPVTLPGISYGSAVWGDYDNDGDLDIALAGTQTNGTAIAQLYSNNGNGTFSIFGAALPGLSRASLAWADYDNDGDLDLALVGTNQTGNLTHLRRNDSFPANDVPEAPSGLTSTIGPSSVSFRWNHATDPQTPSNALTYNIDISPGVMRAQADLATGHRRLPAMGNTQQGTNFTLAVPTNFPGGLYTWRVQAVDSAFAGGPFATGTFEFAGDPTIVSTTVSDITTDQATLAALVNPGGRNTSVAFDFGTSTNYGSQLGTTNIGNGFSNVLATFDLTTLLPDTVYHFRATAFNVLGAFTGPDVSFRTGYLSADPGVVAASLAPGEAMNVTITVSNHLASAVNVTNRFSPPAPVWAAIMNPTISLNAYGAGNFNVLIDATGRPPGVYQAMLQVASSGAHSIVQIPVVLTVLAAQSAEINSVALQSNGAMLLDFTGTRGYAQTVFASTNLQDWTAIGPATQISPGHFQFTDPAATNFPQRFYKIRTP